MEPCHSASFAGQTKQSAMASGPPLHPSPGDQALCCCLSLREKPSCSWKGTCPRLLFYERATIPSTKGACGFLEVPIISEGPGSPLWPAFQLPTRTDRSVGRRATLAWVARASSTGTSALLSSHPTVIMPAGARPESVVGPVEGHRSPHVYFHC